MKCIEMNWIELNELWKEQTLEDGEKIESKNPEVDDGCESLEPKSSEVKEEDEEEEEPNCFLPSIFWFKPLKQTKC
jgi:hypothetical protein